MNDELNNKLAEILVTSAKPLADLTKHMQKELLNRMTVYNQTKGRDYQENKITFDILQIEYIAEIVDSVLRKAELPFKERKEMQDVSKYLAYRIKGFKKH